MWFEPKIFRRINEQPSGLGIGNNCGKPDRRMGGIEHDKRRAAFPDAEPQHKQIRTPVTTDSDDFARLDAQTLQKSSDLIGTIIELPVRKADGILENGLLVPGPIWNGVQPASVSRLSHPPSGLTKRPAVHVAWRSRRFPSWSSLGSMSGSKFTT